MMASLIEDVHGNENGARRVRVPRSESARPSVRRRRLMDGDVPAALPRREPSITALGPRSEPFSRSHARPQRRSTESGPALASTCWPKLCRLPAQPRRASRARRKSSVGYATVSALSGNARRHARLRHVERVLSSPALPCGEPSSGRSERMPPWENVCGPPS